MEEKSNIPLSKLAIASFTSSIFALILMIMWLIPFIIHDTYLSVILAISLIIFFCILAIVLGIFAIIPIMKGLKSGKALALGGIILGIISLILLFQS